MEDEAFNEGNANPWDLKALYIRKKYLMHHNWKTLISKTEVLNSDDLNFISGSSLVGFGATFGANYMQRKFQTYWKELGILYLEFYLSFLMVNKFPLKVQRMYRVFHFDYEG